MTPLIPSSSALPCRGILYAGLDTGGAGNNWGGVGCFALQVLAFAGTAMEGHGYRISPQSSKFNEGPPKLLAGRATGSSFDNDYIELPVLLRILGVFRVARPGAENAATPEPD
jgi:hypothetical protein